MRPHLASLLLLALLGAALVSGEPRRSRKRVKQPEPETTVATQIEPPPDPDSEEVSVTYCADVESEIYVSWLKM